MSVRTVTLDTNLLQEYWKRQPKRHLVEELLDHAAAGKLSLAVTEYIREDIPCPPLAARIKELPSLGILETAGLARPDSWTMDHHILGSEEFGTEAARISDGMRTSGMEPPDRRDWDHVHVHHVLGRDVFLTWDTRLLRGLAQLPREMQVVAMTPEAFLAQQADNTA